MCSICNDPKHDNLDDNLDDLLGGPVEGNIEAAAEFAAAALSNATHTTAREATFEAPCKKCGGRGQFISYTGRVVGNCFTCKGTGKQVFKTSTETRQKQAEAKKARLAAKVSEWIELHKEEWEWLLAETMKGFDFARSMVDALAKYGDLSEGRLNAVRKLMVRDQLRAEERAEIEARAPGIAGESLHKIEQAFATAIAKQIQRPKLRLDTFIFSPVQSGKNAGAIYVKHATEADRNGDRRYLGKIVEGRFVRSFGCSPEEEQRIIAAAAEPEAAATAYGQREGRCSICNRKLTKSESINRAMGPICSENFGW